MSVPWFRSILSRVVFLHVLAIAVTAVITPLVLLWMLSAETDNLHRRLMTDEVMRMSRRLGEGPGTHHDDNRKRKGANDEFHASDAIRLITRSESHFKERNG